VFRKEILALDACVNEEFMKKYVAYKAETNFADIYPLKDSLKLIINLPWPFVSDPKGVCKDVAGSRLNGEVGFILTSLDELPYAMGLVRQSYEHQMGYVEQL
jgi:predicted transport protein